MRTRADILREEIMKNPPLPGNAEIMHILHEDDCSIFDADGNATGPECSCTPEIRRERILPPVKP